MVGLGQDYCLPYHGFCLGDRELLKFLGSIFKILFINSSSMPILDGMFQYFIKQNHEK